MEELGVLNEADEEDGETEEDDIEDGPAVDLLQLFSAAAENTTGGAATAEVTDERPREIRGKPAI